MIVTFGMRARLMAGATALLLPAAAWASDVSGTVSDATGTRTLQGAQVTIVELGRTTPVDENGRYHFADVPAGSYTLHVDYVGVPAEDVAITVADAEVTQDVALGSPESEILVVGQVANLLSSLSRQRAGDGVSNVLTRDAVGQFPDQNVAESLRRLPGINILDDQGEGRFVSVRGLDPNLNSSSVNGVRLPAPESDIRAVALDVVSSDSIESIEVKKTLTPDMDADTIGAAIEINTVSAFDRKKMLLTATAEGSYNHKRDSLTPKLGADFSFPISDGFGIAGGASFYQREFSTDNIEADDWDTKGGVTFADTLEYRDYDVERKRISTSLSFDFRPSPSTTLYLRGIYNQFDDQEFRNRLTFVLDDPSSGDADHAVFNDADERVEVRRDLKDRFERQRIRSLVAGGKTEANGWKFVYSASWAKSSELESGSLDPTRYRARFSNKGVIASFDYSDDDHPVFAITGTHPERVTDPSQYSFNRIERTALSDSRDEEWAARADVTRTLPMEGGELSIQGGVKSRWRTKSYDMELEYYGDYHGSTTFADLLGTQSYGLADLGPVFDWYKTRSFFYDHVGDFDLDADESKLGSNTDDYRAKEDVLAGYALLRWDSSALRVIGGARVEHTSNRLTGNFVDYSTGTINVTHVSFERSYTDWLPSFLVRYAAGPDTVLRFGASRSLVRPNLKDLAPRFVLDDDLEAEFGNPLLRPYKAWNLDASAEYYFSRDAAVTGGVFYKSISDFIVDAHYDASGTYNGIAYDGAVIPVNGDKATVWGAEFSYNQVLRFLPAPLDGLLVNLNYTYTDATGTLFDGREISLPSASKNSFNAVLGYEKGGLSLRLAGTFRDKYLDEIGGSSDADRIVQSHFQLDATAKYWITKRIQVFADWININDAPYFAYRNFSGARRLLQYETYGWTAKGGVKVKF